ncbi:unnamed protein product [Rotaria magnacalcarata]|uniref:ABC transporter domain-containing protein n=4 Tax=Rotaria TaxID=231623 RepID=A0A816ZZ38_9BILA|nr:unnamed protein product [Rotaria magnacalcarata]CAF3894313.1 unnamed protein product [Rotaria magnacalcarata]
MSPLQDNNVPVNTGFDNVDLQGTMPSGDKTHTQYVIEMRGGDTLQVQISVDGAQALAELSPRITVTFYNVSKVIDVPAKMIDPSSKERFIERKLLDQVSGQIHPGQLVALMGPSGCGKTTLLNTLAGRALSGVTGDIWFNNQRYDRSMKRKLAYVLQQDIFFEQLTVKQQLTYTALLRLPNHLSKQDKLAQVEQIIDQLRIRKCANTPIMLISGGEKKRVNIGTELLTNPSVIFLDEPTSGLDSTSAVALMDVLRDLAIQGKTIITSIHQPSSQIFQSFDQLILLADGKTIFMGKPSDALLYFATMGHHSPPQYNPADYVMDLVNQDMTIREQLKDAYLTNKLVGHVKSVSNQVQSQTSTNAHQYLIPEPSGNEPNLTNPDNVNLIPTKHESKWPIGFLPQMMILFKRTFVLTGRRQFTILNFVQALGLAVVSGLCWLRMEFAENTIPDRSSFMFFLMTFWPLQTMMHGLLSFPSERVIIEKERASGSYRLSSYFVAKSLAEAPVKLVLPTLFLIIAYWMANINPNFGIFLAVLAFQLTAVLVAESLGLLLGAALKNLQHAITAATVLLMSLMLVGGFFVRNLPHWLGVWGKWLSFFKYAYNACLQLQFKGGQIYKCIDGSYVASCRNNPNGTFKSHEALEFFDYGISIGFNFLVLFGMFVVFRTLAYLSLRFIKNHSGRS